MSTVKKRNLECVPLYGELLGMVSPCPCSTGSKEAWESKHQASMREGPYAHHQDKKPRTEVPQTPTHHSSIAPPAQQPALGPTPARQLVYTTSNEGAHAHSAPAQYQHASDPGVTQVLFAAFTKLQEEVKTLQQQSEEQQRTNAAFTKLQEKVKTLQRANDSLVRQLARKQDKQAATKEKESMEDLLMPHVRDTIYNMGINCCTSFPKERYLSGYSSAEVGALLTQMSDMRNMAFHPGGYDKTKSVVAVKERAVEAAAPGGCLEKFLAWSGSDRNRAKAQTHRVDIYACSVVRKVAEQRPASASSASPKS